MTTTNQSIADALSRNSTATANFLASLNASVDNGSGLSKLFDSLLDQSNTSAAQTKSSAANCNSTTTTAANTSDITTTLNVQAPAPKNIGDIVNALHNFVTKWNNYQQSHPHSASPQSANNSKPQACVPHATQTTGTATDTKTSSTSDNTSTVNDTTTTASTDTTNAAPTTAPTTPPPTFADMLTQLQAIFQMLQQQIQTAQKAAPTGDITTTDTSTPSTQDLLAAGGALADLLALAQILEKKFGVNSTPSVTDPTNTATTVAANATTNANTPDLAALDTQLRTNLKNMLDQLQAATTQNAATSSQVSANTATNTTDLTLTSTTTASTTSINQTPVTTVPADVVLQAVKTADDILKQLNTLFTTNRSGVTPTVTADAVTAPTDASFDANQNGNGASTSGNNATTGAQATTNLADAQKASGPYNFASQLSAARAQNGGTTGLPTVVEQVLLQLNRNAKSGNDQMTIQLHPADLGSINVKLNITSSGTVTGTIVAENADTLALLQKDHRTLERALQDAGLQTDPGSLKFSLADQNPNPNQTNKQATGNDGNGKNADASGTNLAGLITEIDDSAAQNWVITPNRVNIQV